MILAIDPSLSSGTGLVILDFDVLAFTEIPKIHASACIKPDAKTTELHDRCRFIAQAISSWIDTYAPTLIAIEEPPARVKAMSYTRADGTKGSRIVVSPGQHRLIGQIEGVAIMKGVRVVLVAPGDAKKAVGLPAKEKRKPVAEVEHIVGHRLADTKYASEAIADAFAVGMVARGMDAAQAS